MDLNWDALAENIRPGQMDDDKFFDLTREKLRQYNVSSGSFSYGHQASADHVRQIMDDPLVPRVLSPGDFVYQPPGCREFRLRTPVAADVWFLWGLNNILPEIRSGEWEVVASSPILKALDPILKRYPGLLPLLAIQSPDEITVGEDFNVQAMEMQQSFELDARYHIKEARFESWSCGYEMQFYSEGPPWMQQSGLELSEFGGLSNVYAGYMAFPIGPLGVQEALSLVSETMEEGSNECQWENPGDVQPADLQDHERVQEGGRVFPPDLNTYNSILGKKILDTAYLPFDNNLEIAARNFEGYDDPEPMFWARYYFPESSKFPMPGEFVGLVCKTMPFVVWWFQQSQPFLYSGNWFETEFYTSGVVLEKYPPDPEKGEVGTVYKVLCKGEEIYLFPTDFKEYETGDRVAILKNEEWTKNFSWADLKWSYRQPDSLERRIEMDEYLSDKTPRQLAEIDMFIVPATFYRREA